ncbi:MAG: COX15/CtaA family protein [Rhodoferax sp.]
MVVSAHPAYDWSPTLSLLLLGTLLALVPLVWLIVRSRRSADDPAQRLHQLRLLILFLTFDLVVFGAFTRLTDSGLGCPDWPGCYGSATPLGAHQAIALAEQTLPTGPVTHQKAWIEMVHRYWAMVVGALILWLCVWGTWVWSRSPLLQRHRLLPPVWNWALLLWVCLQGAFGAWTVTFKLMPVIVTGHLLLALGLLALMAWSFAKSQMLLTTAAHSFSVAAGGVRRKTVAAVMGLLWAQIALGAWVSTNYAVLACQDFPTCQGQWWPAMDFGPGFTVWRPLGLQADGQPLPFPALTAIHMAHRTMAVVVLGAMGGLAWRLRSCGVRRRLAAALAALMFLQALTGISNVVLAWPLVAALLHTAGAAALVIVLTLLLAVPVQREQAAMCSCRHDVGQCAGEGGIV